MTSTYPKTLYHHDGEQSVIVNDFDQEYTARCRNFDIEATDVEEEVPDPENPGQIIKRKRGRPRLHQ